MGAPASAAFNVCLCSHTQRRHEDEGFGACLAAACGCTEFRDTEKRIEPTQPLDPAQITLAKETTHGTPIERTPPLVGDLGSVPVYTSPGGDALAAARKSPRQGTRKLAQQVEEKLALLRSRLAEEDKAAAERRAERERRERLVAELAEVEIRRAALRAQIAPGRRAATARPTPDEPGEYRCAEPGCGLAFTTSQGVAMHSRRAHGDLRGAVPGSNNITGQKATTP